MQQPDTIHLKTTQTEIYNLHCFDVSSAGTKEKMHILANSLTKMSFIHSFIHSLLILQHKKEEKGQS